MPKIPLWQLVMLVIGAVGYFAHFFGASPILIFALAAIGLVPLAALIGQATEALAHYIGPKWGGLLNATFGNMAELIIGGVALSAGLYDLVKASITGSIIGNLLLVLGASVMYGGVKHGVQRFDAREAGRNATMMLMAIFGLVLPAVYAYSDPDATRVEEVSLVVALALLIVYFAYILYSFRSGEDNGGPGIAKEMHIAEPADDEVHQAPLTRTAALIMLALATLATVFLAETLVGEVESIVKQFGVSEFFIGAIVVPIVGNVAEHFSAVSLAGKNKMDITLGIAAGSSTQVALLVAPILVILSLFLGPAPRGLATAMNLVFLPLEIVAVTASGLLFNYISIDGETNWLEGLQLVVLYAIVAAIFFLLQTPGLAGH